MEPELNGNKFRTLTLSSKRGGCGRVCITSWDAQEETQYHRQACTMVKKEDSRISAALLVKLKLVKLLPGPLRQRYWIERRRTRGGKVITRSLPTVVRAASLPPRSVEPEMERA